MIFSKRVRLFKNSLRGSIQAMLNQQINSSNYIHQKINQIMKNNHDDIYIQANGIIQIIDDASVTGNNRKYLELYDKIAPLYRISNAIYFALKFGGERNYRNEFLSELEIKPGDKVLETSVGAGDNFRYLPKNVELYGLDLSYGMLKQAVKNAKRWKKQAYFFQGNAEDLPFKDDCFDVVFHVGGINFFNNKQAAITEMIRVAKSGTKIVIVDETEKLIESTYKKTPITKDYFPTGEQIGAPLELIPNEMQDVTCKEVCKGLMYCLTFRKP